SNVSFKDASCAKITKTSSLQSQCCTLAMVLSVSSGSVATLLGLREILKKACPAFLPLADCRSSKTCPGHADAETAAGMGFGLMDAGIGSLSEGRNSPPWCAKSPPIRMKVSGDVVVRARPQIWPMA